MSKPNPESDEHPSDSIPLSRRDLVRGSVVGLSAVGGAAVVVLQGDEASADVTGAAMALSTMAVKTDDGTISGITMGDDGSGVDIQWEGYDSGPTYDVSFGVELTGGGDGTATAREFLASGSVSLSGTSGDANKTWSTLFGSSEVDITNHSEISLTSFESTTDGATYTREAKVTFQIDDSAYNNLVGTVTDTATGMIDVTNIGANADIGGTVNTTINSS